MKLSEELKARGFINQFSGESLEKILDGEKRTFYWGTDASSDSLTIGNLAPCMFNRHLADAGHKPILLVGGATSMIGDPGGKESERTLLDKETLKKNVSAVAGQVANILKVKDVTLVNNADWLGKLSLVDFLRDIGKYFTVNAMIKKDLIKSRLDAESPISVTEFSYSLLQGYDFRHLFDTYNCTLQIAGSDQWSNAIAGVDFIRKTRQAEVSVVTMPLVIDKITGRKFGKSEGNAIWLDSNKTSIYDFYQFWLNVSDEDVVERLKIYTLFSLDEIAELEQKMQSAPQERVAQKALAYEVTKFVHGEEAASGAQNVSEVLFGGKEIDELNDADVAMLKKEAPTHGVKEGVMLIDVLVESKLVTSKTEARKMIEGGAVSISGVKITDVNFDLGESDFVNGIALLRKGKKQLMVLILG